MHFIMFNVYSNNIFDNTVKIKPVNVSSTIFGSSGDSNQSLFGSNSFFNTCPTCPETGMKYSDKIYTDASYGFYY